MNPIVSIVAGVLRPLADLVDSLHTSEDEKGRIRVALAAAHVEFASKILDYEARMLEAQSSIIRAEANGASWIQRSWRPITMLTFLGLVVFDAFGLLPFRLAGEAWTLLQIGLGGYVAGRSAEKVIPLIAATMRESSAKS